MKDMFDEALEKIDVEFDAWDRAEHLELFELVEQALELGKLYSQLVNKNLQVNLNILEKIKELENEY